MKKKFTIMIFDESRLGEVKTRKLSSNVLYTVITVMFLYAVASSASFFYLHNLYKQTKDLIVYKHENAKLKKQITGQIAGYENQLVVINDKLASVVELENKVRGLSAYGGRARGHQRQLAVGGKEYDLTQDISALSARKDKDYFKDLSSTLNNLGSEIEKRTISLSELADFLEQQKIVASSTPSIWPTNGWVSSPFGYRMSPFTGRRTLHEGLDIASNVGAPVRSTAKGIVVFAGRQSGYGKLVIIDHGFGYMTKYGHNSQIMVHAGERVSKGQVISRVGSTGRSTGPHVHYEVLINGVPVNPFKFIASAK